MVGKRVIMLISTAPARAFDDRIVCTHKIEIEDIVKGDYPKRYRYQGTAGHEA